MQETELTLQQLQCIHFYSTSSLKIQQKIDNPPRIDVISQIENLYYTYPVGTIMCLLNGLRDL